MKKFLKTLSNNKMESQIIYIFDRIKDYTLKSISNSNKYKKPHDPWEDTGMGYDANWIANELSLVQNFLLKALPEFEEYKIHIIDDYNKHNTDEIYNALLNSNPKYFESIIKVFKYFRNIEYYGTIKGTDDNDMVEKVKSLFS